MQHSRVMKRAPRQVFTNDPFVMAVADQEPRERPVLYAFFHALYHARYVCVGDVIVIRVMPLGCRSRRSGGPNRILEFGWDASAGVPKCASGFALTVPMQEPWQRCWGSKNRIPHSSGQFYMSFGAIAARRFPHCKTNGKFVWTKPLSRVEHNRAVAFCAKFNNKEALRLRVTCVPRASWANLIDMWERSSVFWISQTLARCGRGGRLPDARADASTPSMH